jgi:hypothetical protein
MQAYDIIGDIHGHAVELRALLASLDYGTGKGGFLCAYRWDGEGAMGPEKFVTAPEEDEK